MRNFKNFFKTHKLLKILFLLIIGIFIVLRLSSLIVQHQVEAGKWVEVNGKWYFNEKDLREVFPAQYIDTPAKNTPEEVYTNFRQALLNNEIDVALSYIREENRGGQRDALIKFGDLVALGNIYPEKIEQEKIEGNFATFGYVFIKEGREIKSIAEFRKGSDGYWFIENI